MPLVLLTSEEITIYKRLTKRIGWALLENDNFQNNEMLTSLLMQRSRLVGSAVNKLIVLKEIMAKRLHTSHTLFYCGDSAVNNSYANLSLRQLEAVARILGAELGYRINTYTSENSLDERELMRSQFEQGEIQGLVAIRCLDEGVDIPAIKTAIILASTGNPRQFIQRRGRILRPYPGKEKATLFDMIVVPPELDREALETEKRLVSKELKRFREFADLASNRDEANQILGLLEEKYGLVY